MFYGNRSDCFVHLVITSCQVEGDQLNSEYYVVSLQATKYSSSLIDPHSSAV